MKSPFKFLDAFALKDKDAFFGRDQEIETLYSLVFKTPLILVYGWSGTGKTSLVQCGLASRFDGPDWYPIFIRRNANFNTSVDSSMRNALGDMATDSLAGNVSILLRETLRPVYLIFDQFEELFIFGKEEEQQLFMNSLRELLDTRLPSKIIIIMREDNIGQLYPHETLVPELSYHRFRVEPMGPTKVKNVISSSFEKFNIQLAEPKEELLDTMVQNINDPRAGIMLPYLQLYLDRLYRETYRKQFGEIESEGYPKIEITLGDIDGIGRIDTVLERFLEDQTGALLEQLKQKYKIVKPGIIAEVLDVFVSEKGTKRPIEYKLSGDTIMLAEDFTTSLKGIPAPVLTDIINTLHEDRILRRSAENYELAHDSLALAIDRQRSQSQRQLQDIRKRMANAFEEYQKTGALLNQKQLEYFDDFRPQLGLSPEMEKFLDECEQELNRKIKEDKDRLQQERLQQEKEKAQQAKQIRTRGILLVMAITLAGLAVGMWLDSKSKEKQLNRLYRDIVENTKIAMLQKDSIANIILEVDQQIGRMDSIMSGQLPQTELAKTLITLKSLVRNDTTDASEINTKYISVLNIFMTNKLNKKLDQAPQVSVFQTPRIHLVLHVNTPRDTELISVKWLTAYGKPIADPSYVDVVSGPDKTQWISVSTAIRSPGDYKAEVYNSQGKEVGHTTFTIDAKAMDEISMTEHSDFRPMGSGDMNNVKPEKTIFKTGEMIYFYFRVNSPKAGKVVTVSLVDETGKTIWIDDFTMGVNTGIGYRGWGKHGAWARGKYKLYLMTREGDVLSEKDITIE